MTMTQDHKFTPSGIGPVSNGTGRTAWQVIDDACQLGVTGELAITTPANTRIRVYLMNGLVYYAEHDTDDSLATRLVASGALDARQMQQGLMMINGAEHLGRMFERDTTIDRDAVEVAIEAITEDTLTTISDQVVQSFRTTMYRHHPSGIHRWYSSQVAADADNGSTMAPIVTIVPLADGTRTPAAEPPAAEPPAAAVAPIADTVPTTVAEPAPASVAAFAPEPAREFVAPVIELRPIQPIVEPAVEPAVQPTIEPAVVAADAPVGAPADLFAAVSAAEPTQSRAASLPVDTISPTADVLPAALSTTPSVSTTPEIVDPMTMTSTTPAWGAPAPAPEIPLQPAASAAPMPLQVLTPITPTPTLTPITPTPITPTPIASTPTLTPITAVAPAPTVPAAAAPAPALASMPSLGVPAALTALTPFATLDQVAPLAPLAPVAPLAAPAPMPTLATPSPTPSPVTPPMGTPSLAAPSLGTPALGTPSLAGPTMPAPSLGAPAMPAPALPTPAFGTPSLGTPTLGTPAPVITPLADVAPTPAPQHLIPPLGATPVPADVAAAVRRAINAIEAATLSTGQGAVSFGAMRVATPGATPSGSTPVVHPAAPVSGQQPAVGAQQPISQPVVQQMATVGGAQPLQAMMPTLPSPAPTPTLQNATGPTPITVTAAGNGTVAPLMSLAPRQGMTGSDFAPASPGMITGAGPVLPPLETKAAEATPERRSALRRLIAGIRGR